MSSFVNPHAHPADVAPPTDEAGAFHASLDGYAATPLHPLPHLAEELGVAAVGLKDESNRLGLPAFKILGASWALERALQERPNVHTVVAASAGNHGRAAAHEASRRGLCARIFLPSRSPAARRRAIEAEGAEVIVVDGRYEDAVVASRIDAARPGRIELADVGDSGPAHWVIDGYATLFDETLAQGTFDVLLVPVGVGSLAAAAARFGALHGIRVVGVEPGTAACLTASLAAGERTTIETPGTSMAGLDCAEVSEAAWPSLLRGVHGTVTVDEGGAAAAVAELEGRGHAIGHSGAATLAGLRVLATEPGRVLLRDAVGLGGDSRVLLVATEGRTDLG